MELKSYLIETFRFNDFANRNMIKKVGQLPDKQTPVLHLNHLINSQDKWLARIEQYPNDPNLDWWKPVRAHEELETAWKISVEKWITFLETKTEPQLFEEAHFVGKDGGHWSAPLKDIALQLNYHSIHHRAQIQMMIRQQGIEPDFIDYIGTAYKKY